MPTRRLTMLKLDCFKKITSKSVCQHLRYAQSLNFLCITISNKFYGLMKDEPTSTTTIVVLATMLKMALFTYLEYSRVDG